MRSTILLFSLCLAMSIHAQKIPLYHTLDSIKASQKGSLAATPAAARDSLEDYYRDIRDSVRDLAHDCADSIIVQMDRSSHFELGLDMASNQYYYGRRGPAGGAVGTPSLRYMNWTGLYAMFNADVYDLKYSLIRKARLKTDTIAGNKIEPDLTFTAGFAHTFYDRWDLELFYDHTVIFYGTDKNLLSNTLDANTSFDFWDYITAGVIYEFMFGGSSKDANKKKLSNVLTFDLYKDFKIYRLPGSAILSIGPELSSDVGNDNLVRSRVIARSRHGGENVPELYDNFFGLMDLEGAVNVDYRIKNLDISFTPHVALPFNEIPANLPATATVASLAQYRQNQMQPPIFYATVSIKYYFRFWHEHKHKTGPASRAY